MTLRGFVFLFPITRELRTTGRVSFVSLPFRRSIFGHSICRCVIIKICPSHCFPAKGDLDRFGNNVLPLRLPR